MTTVKPQRKPYRSPRRSEQVDATRRRILDAARQLFAQRGYAGATMEAIAVASGLAVPTVYKNFGNKRLLLVKLIDTELYTPDYVQVQRARPRERLQAMARMIVNYASRAADVTSIVAGAIGADPGFEQLLRRIRGDRRLHAARMAHSLAQDRALRPDRTEEQASAILYSLVGLELYDLFVKRCSWSDEQFESWLSDTLAELLLSPGREVRRRAKDRGRTGSG
jgi:AcrR family transcriptional regulator